MHRENPKYSILIPTRNGWPYVSYAIQSVLEQEYLNYELIVSVNHSRDETLSRLGEFKNPQMRILVPPRELSMSKHFEFILAHASGEWITVLGDDDALMPYFFVEADKLLKKHYKSKLFSSERAYYFWNGCQELYGNTVIAYKGFRGSNRHSSKASIILALLGLKSYMDLPQLYTTGLFHKSIVQKIKNISGGIFYHSIIPDAYSCVAGLLVTDQFTHSNLPLFWVGSSPKSNGFSHTASKMRSEPPSDVEFYQGTPTGATAHDFHTLALADKLSINPSIPKSLFLSGYNSLFVYEALLQCPFANVFFKSSLFRNVFFASMLIELVGKESSMATRKVRPHFKSLHLIYSFLADIKSGSLGIVSIIFLLPLVALLRAILLVFLLPSKLVDSVRPKINFRVDSHDKYSTILDASEHLNQILTSKVY